MAPKAPLGSTRSTRGSPRSCTGWAGSMWSSRRPWNAATSRSTSSGNSKRSGESSCGCTGRPSSSAISLRGSGWSAVFETRYIARSSRPTRRCRSWREPRGTCGRAPRRPSRRRYCGSPAKTPRSLTKADLGGPDAVGLVPGDGGPQAILQRDLRAPVEPLPRSRDIRPRRADIGRVERPVVQPGRPPQVLLQRRDDLPDRHRPVAPEVDDVVAERVERLQGPPSDVFHIGEITLLGAIPVQDDRIAFGDP